MKEINFFTDGAVPNNQKRGRTLGGSGVFFGDDDPRNISYTLTPDEFQKITNQVAELYACIIGINKLIHTTNIVDCYVTLHTDSMYIVNSINKWADGWYKKDWRKSDGKIIENLELMTTLYFLVKNTGINIKHVKAHSVKPRADSSKYIYWYGNNQADLLAVNACI